VRQTRASSWGCRYSSQQSLVLGSEASWALSASQSVALGFATAVVHKNAPDATGVAIRCVFNWDAT